jgi:hypothetical protein
LSALLVDQKGFEAAALPLGSVSAPVRAGVPLPSRNRQLSHRADRLSAQGLGASAPVANNASDEGRAKNRRVELIKQ